MNKCILYHGSNQIINKPIYHGGKPTNDYGYGFYCTEIYELACEWASKQEGNNAYVNRYSIDLDKLKVLDLTNKKYSILNWLAILLKYRTFTCKSIISVKAKKYIINNYLIDISEYDVIKGYRADDSYFSFAQDFLNNTISLQQLEKAMKLGKLGIQYVITSKHATNSIEFIDVEEVDKLKYYKKQLQRDIKAREDYYNMKIEELSNEIYVKDLLGGSKNGNSCL